MEGSGKRAELVSDEETRKKRRNTEYFIHCLLDELDLEARRADSHHIEHIQELRRYLSTTKKHYVNDGTMGLPEEWHNFKVSYTVGGQTYTINLHKYYKNAYRRAEERFNESRGRVFASNHLKPFVADDEKINNDKLRKLDATTNGVLNTLERLEKKINEFEQRLNTTPYFRTGGRRIGR